MGQNGTPNEDIIVQKGIPSEDTGGQNGTLNEDVVVQKGTPNEDIVGLKGTQNEDIVGLKMWKISKYFHKQSSYGCFFSLHAREVLTGFKFAFLRA